MCCLWLIDGRIHPVPVCRYFGSMDIAHDRAGFYLCWGCLVWVPSVYTSPAMYLVRRPVALHPLAAAGLLLAGRPASP